jgi:hypothetical protein
VAADAATPRFTLDRAGGGISIEAATGAGGDNGIANMWNRRGISVSSHYDKSHYLHLHP